MQATAWPFIEVDDSGHPLIQGIRFKALTLIREHLAYDWSAEQIRKQHPQLRIEQIYSVLGFYHEHQNECDRMLEDEDKEIDSLRLQTENRSLQERLRQLKEGE